MAVVYLYSIAPAYSCKTKDMGRIA